MAESITKDERHRIVMARIGELYKSDPDVTIRFMDKDRILRFTNRAVLDVLKDTGHNMLEGGKISDLTDPDLLGSLLHRGMQHHWPDVTRESVDEHFAARHLVYYQTKLMEALQLFMPDVSDLPEVDNRGEIVDRPSSAQTGNGSVTGVSAAS
jgi:hypothetical protein